MRTVFSVSPVLLYAFSLNAQIAVTLNRLPDGSSEIRIKSNAPMELAAVAIVANVHGGGHAPFTAYDDSTIPLPQNPAVGRHNPLTPLAANREAVFQLALLCGTDRFVAAVIRGPEKKSAKLCEFEQPVAAGIFVDGSTAGDASLVRQIIVRRSSALQALDATLEVLSDAGRRNAPREQLVERFKNLADALNRWYVLPEQQVGRDIYEGFAAKLMNLPELEAGAPFPPSSFVARESQVLRQQRAVLLESFPRLAGAAVPR